jgi:hypothetical protein
MSKRVRNEEVDTLHLTMDDTLEVIIYGPVFQIYTANAKLEVSVSCPTESRYMLIDYARFLDLQRAEKYMSKRWWARIRRLSESFEK